MRPSKINRGGSEYIPSSNHFLTKNFYNKKFYYLYPMKAIYPIDYQCRVTKDQKVFILIDNWFYYAPNQWELHKKPKWDRSAEYELVHYCEYTSHPGPNTAELWIWDIVVNYYKNL